MGGIFGGKKEKSSSKNQAFGTINNWAQPLMGYANEGASGMSALLGGDSSGLDKFKSATGFNQALADGLTDTTNAGAAKGILRSGGLAKGLTRFAAGLNNQYANNYMQHLLGLAGIGTGAASTLTNAGQTSTSSGKSKNGIGGFLGSAAGAITASDRRVKVDIKKVGEYEDGLGIYEYAYVWKPNETITGVMADEVEKLRPWALGPKIGDYATVDYGRL